jgi:CheY-like chemotaxis protein
MRRARILLVDDNRVNRKLLAAVLEADGHRVDEAGSGREAVEGCRLLPYDLVLMDIQMADMDGLAAAAAIRALGGRQGEVPIVAISGDVENDVEERCLAAGMNGHLPKPVSPAMLTDAVARWARTRTLAPSAGASGPVAATDARLGGLAADLSNETLAPIVDEFISGSTLRMVDIERAAAAGDLSRLRGIAHDLSGSAANLGFMDLSRIARSVESACIDAAAESVRRLVPETRAALQQVLATLAARRQSLELSH